MSLHKNWKKFLPQLCLTLNDKMFWLIYFLTLALFTFLWRPVAKNENNKKILKRSNYKIPRWLFILWRRVGKSVWNPVPGRNSAASADCQSSHFMISEYLSFQGPAYSTRQQVTQSLAGKYICLGSFLRQSAEFHWAAFSQLITDTESKYSSKWFINQHYYN